MKKSLFFLLVLSGLGLFSCSNEVDLTGEYKDTPIVYCLLNPKDTAHYIRIQKAFLVDGNVLQTAKIPDSLTYNPSDLDVKIVALSQVDSNLTDTITFAYQPGAVTDTGLFAKEGIMLYKSTAELNVFAQYKLLIVNKKLNKKITSRTGLVYSFVFKTPSGSGVVNLNSTSLTGYTLRWISAVNGRIYQPEIVFRWREVPLSDPNSAGTPDSLVWRLTAKESTSNALGAEMDLNLPQNSFYRYVGEHVPVKTGIKRVIGMLSFRFYVGTQELATYVDVNKPSVGLIQEKPVYTNITNGLGIFSGRSLFVKDMSMGDPGKDTLIFGKFTDKLSFRKL